MKRDIKEKIIEATIKLIEERESNPEDITVRDICSAAEIGLSQINYHFQTKENLLAQCIQVMIGGVIDAFPIVLASVAGGSAVDTLKRMMLNTLNFLYLNENISRISILTDHKTARQNDNTAQTIEVYCPLIAATCEERNIQEDPKKLTTMMILTLQGIFLRTNVIKDDWGLDLRSESGRKQLIDEYVDSIFRQA